MILALILFIITYILMLAFQKQRPLIALASALVFLLTGMLSPGSALAAIDFNVLLMIAGTMGTVALVIESKMPFLLSDLIVERVPNVKWAIVILSLFAGIVSAFIDNVATVLMIAPIALAMAKRLEISPVNMVISIAVSSNLQGAATLVGDTTSILLGGYADMSFNDFFWYRGEPGIFFAVELGALVSCVISASTSGTARNFTASSGLPSRSLFKTFISSRRNRHRRRLRSTARTMRRRAFLNVMSMPASRRPCSG